MTAMALSTPAKFEAGLVSKLRRRMRLKRGEVFRQTMAISESDRVLDLGGGLGHHIHALLPEHRNVVVADVLPGENPFGYEQVLLDKESLTLPFPDAAFDVVFCNSVIEHATGPWSWAVACRDGRAFERSADRHQAAMAAEIRRVTRRRYFVQTPHRHFPVESHSLLPAPLALAPRPVLLPLLAIARRLWIKRTFPDWRLLDRSQMGLLFPDAEIRAETVLGFTKSWMAVRS